jgi:hypothetical protein
LAVAPFGASRLQHVFSKVINRWYQPGVRAFAPSASVDLFFFFSLCHVPVRWVFNRFRIYRETAHFFVRRFTDVNAGSAGGESVIYGNLANSECIWHSASSTSISRHPAIS